MAYKRSRKKSVPVCVLCERPLTKKHISYLDCIEALKDYVSVLEERIDCLNEDACRDI